MDNNQVFFKEGNNLMYGQDFSFWKNVPANIVFTIKSETDKFWVLEGKGYGQKDDYGNGAIYLYKDGFKYITQRGVRTNTRPYRTISREEKRKILDDFLSIGSRETRKKWNLSSATLHHIEWHNRDMEDEIEEEHFRQAGL